MADRPGGEPTEQPTPKRLQDARKKGEIARSRDLSTAAVFVAATAALVASGPALLAALGGYLRRSLEQAPELAQRASEQPTLLAAAFHPALTTGARVLMPLFACVLGAALLIGALQARGIFTLEPLKPKLDKLNPGAGLKRLFSAGHLFEVGKGLLVATVVGYFVLDVLRDALGPLVRLVGRTPAEVTAALGAASERLLYRALVLYVIVGVADYGIAWRRHRKQLMMTKEEVKREARESEGDPHHKAERQRLHRELLEGRMLDEVRDADCVIVNPVRIAVALRYDRERMNAPQVVARGEAHLAERIREEARRHGVPIFRNVPLARALVGLEVGSEIPADLYEAVAEVLRFVYGLGQGQTQGQTPGQTQGQTQGQTPGKGGAT